MTTKIFLQQWLATQKGQVKLKTFVRYAEIVKNNISPFLGDVEIDKLTSTRVREFIASIGEGHADNTVLQIMGVLKRALTCAVQMGLIHTNPAQGIPLKRRQKNVEPFTEYEQRVIERYILEAQDSRYYGVLIALYTGVRIGELLALTWRDVDLKSHMLTISKTEGTIKIGGGANPYLSTPKTAAGNRTIPYPKQLQPLFKQLKAQGSEYVISTRKGKFMTVCGYQKTFAKLLDKLGIKHRGFHSLRHTFATRALEVGADIRTLSEMLGHSSPTVTLTRYCHSTYKQKAKLCERLGDNLKKVRLFLQ